MLQNLGDSKCLVLCCVVDVAFSFHVFTWALDFLSLLLLLLVCDSIDDPLISSVLSSILVLSKAFGDEIGDAKVFIGSWP